MNFKQLLYYVTTVEEGTISRAAKKLYMSQPPLSVQISLLEEEIGLQLFERTAHQIILTEPGKLLYERAKDLLRMLEVTEEEVRDFGKNRGIIRAGIISSAVNTQFTNFLSQYIKKNPGLHLEIYESNTYELLEQIKNKTIHFAIVRTPFQNKSLKHIKLSSSSLVAIGAPEFFENSSVTMSLLELSKQPLIVYRRWYTIIKDTFHKLDIPINVICINDDARTSIYFAEQKLGIALVPNSVQECSSKKLQTYEIKSNPWKTDIVFIYDEKIYMPKYVKELIQQIPIIF